MSKKLPDDVAIRVHDIHKDFHLPHHSEDSFKRRVTQIFKKKDKGVDIHRALRGLTFDIKKGEFFGIVGRNGSGKSTLLKIISEIYQPTSGYVKTQGKVVAFIELGVGFNPQLSGRENVYLNGAMLGFSQHEIDEMYAEIVEFAELEDFMDQRLKNYSSGMKVRLAFSVAIRAQADILILDEVLAVGDADFQRKCYEYFQNLKDEHKTIVLVSHSMNLIKQYCDKAILINDGKIAVEGDSNKVADEYTMLFDVKKSKNDTANIPQLVDTKVSYERKDNKLFFSFTLTPRKDLDDSILAVLIYNKNTQIYRWVSDENTNKKILFHKDVSVNATLTLQDIFPVGKYRMDVQIKKKDRSETYALVSGAVDFSIDNTTGYQYRTAWRPNENFVVD